MTRPAATERIRKTAPASHIVKEDLPPRRRGRPPVDLVIRRDRIMDVAERLFAAHGYAATSLEAIAASAGVTKRTIYKLIGDKRTLFRTVSTRMCVVAGTFAFDLPIEDMPVRAVLIGMATSLLAHALHADNVAVVRLIAKETMHFPELAPEVMDEGRVALNQGIAEVFRALAADGRIAPLDPPWAADVFYDLVIGNKAMRALLGYTEHMPSEAEIGQRVDIMLRGLLGPDSAEN